MCKFSKIAKSARTLLSCVKSIVYSNGTSHRYKNYFWAIENSPRATHPQKRAQLKNTHGYTQTSEIPHLTVCNPQTGLSGTKEGVQVFPLWEHISSFNGSKM